MNRKLWICDCSLEDAKRYMMPGYFEGWKDKEIRQSEKPGMVSLYGIMKNPPSLSGRPE